MYGHTLKENILGVRAFTDTHEAWRFLQNHPIFSADKKRMISQFEICLSIDVVKVNPRNETVEDDPKKNTATRVWLECGAWTKQDELDEEERKNFPYGE